MEPKEPISTPKIRLAEVNELLRLVIVLICLIR